MRDIESTTGSYEENIAICPSPPGEAKFAVYLYNVRHKIPDI